MSSLPSYIPRPPFHELKIDKVISPLESQGEGQDTLVMAEQLDRKSMSTQNHGAAIQILACKSGQ